MTVFMQRILRLPPLEDGLVFVPLALTILAAMLFNILCIHILMAPEGLPMAIIFVAVELFLLWSYRDRFAGILRP